MNRTEFIKNWVQIIAICAAGLWAAYTFVFAEYVKVPKFLTVSVEIGRETPLKNKLIPIHLKISAHNGGSRPVYIEYAYFELQGEKINELPIEKFARVDYENSLMNGNLKVNGFKRGTSILIGSEQLFKKTWLESEESAVEDKLLFVNPDQFDELEAVAYVLQTFDEDKIDLKATVNDNLQVNFVVREKGGQWLDSDKKKSDNLLNKYTRLAKDNRFLALGEK